MLSSAMVLVKNEEYWLPYVLKQTIGIFDSYVIYDVGSTDKTRNIIDWFAGEIEGKADALIRLLPDCPPEIQGTFRNSMILEGKKPLYWILDGDELYPQSSLDRIQNAANSLATANRNNPRKKYGVVKRVEVNHELTKQYDVRRGHHRLYTSDAYWTGTHPGEVAYYAQNHKSEVMFDNIVCYHMHNASRSRHDSKAWSRTARKGNKTYHPGELIDLNLLDELPILRDRIENFPVAPSLEKLWEEV